MMITTKGRYALRIMTDLALHKNDGYISLTDISKRQNISIKYLENIISILNKEKLVLSKRGKNGGYKLAKELTEYNIYEIITSCQTLTPVKCLELNHSTCKRKNECYTVKLWQTLDTKIKTYLQKLSLNDLLEQNF